jgi:cytochrome c-type biogenesis protein CcmF
VTTTVAQEFVRGAQVRRSATGTDLFTAMVGLFARSRRRYAGYIVHVGVVLMFLGFAGEGFKREEQALLTPGQQVDVGHFTIRHDALRVAADAQKQIITGHVTVFENGKEIDTMEPAKWFFHKRADEQPTTEVAIRRRPNEDLYIVLAGFTAESQAATYVITVNPLVNWIWFGFGVMAIASIIALLPERAFAFAAAKLPASAATTTSLILAIAMLSAAPMAQESSSATQVSSKVPLVEKSELRKQLEAEIMCTCGGCRAPMNDCPMGPSCHGLEEQNARLDKVLAAGMNREQILAAFVADAGSQEVLMAPLDQGFNRLAWLLPYLVGASGAIIAGIVALRWSRRESRAADDRSVTAVDPSLQARLDDELRDID